MTRECQPVVQSREAVDSTLSEVASPRSRLCDIIDASHGHCLKQMQQTIKKSISFLQWSIVRTIL